MIERDKKGKFSKGHGWDFAVIQKMKQTKLSKSIYKERTSVCESCDDVFSFRPNKFHPNRRFCSKKCLHKKGGRSGIPLCKKSKRLMSEKMSGVNNPLYISGCSKSRKDEYKKDYEIRDWRNAVFKRDNYTCQKCFKNKVKLNADHIKTWSEHPKLRFDINNGRTLCVNCHKEVTREWMRKNWKNQYS